MKINLKFKNQAARQQTILIEENLMTKLPALLKQLLPANKYAIITDSKVEKLYAKKLKQNLVKHGIKAEIFSFPQGEKSKNLNTIEKIAEDMIGKNFDRGDSILALGGGVPGDIAGFLASIYMRGITYAQIPTTLLAMVDSSIGGKTGVDLIKGGKNLLGTITQAQAVFIDSTHLKSLSKSQIRSGLAEVIKYGVIKDSKLFHYIEKNPEKILNLESKSINHIIERSVKIKSEIVLADEKENGDRMLLNYGHTYGHALEKLSNYKLLHGYAISIGMVIANKMAMEKGLLQPAEAEKIKSLLHAAGLPISTMKKPSKKDLMSDKKKIASHLNFILAKGIGKAIIHQEKIS